jgi:hypothetical protein
MLLTWRGSSFFSQWTTIGRARRTARDKLVYIFIVLATPNAGVGVVDYEAIVEVLARLPYPLPSNPRFRDGKRREELHIMAERLDPLGDKTIEAAVQITSDNLAPLADLVTSLTGRSTESTMESLPLPTPGLSLDQFLEWSRQTQLLEALDRLFGVMLQPLGSTDSDVAAAAV